uniref:ADF-H domain-containing protein n=1 Tax=Panagrolaimus sp. ES5 TaxID=591445 RepID=A0AC34FIN3_9BILA
MKRPVSQKALSPSSSIKDIRSDDKSLLLAATNMDALKQMKNKIVDMLNQFEAQLILLRKALDEKEKQQAKLKKEHGRKIAENAHLKADIENQRITINQQIEEIHKNEVEIIRMKEAYDKKLAKLSAEIAQLKAELEQQQEKINQQIEDKKEYEAKILELQEHHRMKEEKLQAEIDRLKSVINANQSSDSLNNSLHSEPTEDEGIDENVAPLPLSATASISGIVVNPDCERKFQQIYGRKLRYIIFKIKNEKEIVIDIAKSNSDIGVYGDDYDENSKKAYQNLINELKISTNEFADGRYAAFDFNFKSDLKGIGMSKCNKIVFIQLCFDKAFIKNRTLYSTSASAIKSTLGTERFIVFQASEESDLSHEKIFDELNNKFCDN